MLFNSSQFLLLFLPATLGVYLLLLRFDPRLPKLWLVLASAAFYVLSEPNHIGWLVFSMAVNYALSLPLAAFSAGPRKRTLLTIGIVFNLALLCFYKYTGFILSWFGGGSNADGLQAPALPLAISFVTFTQIAYLLDVYHRQTQRGSLLNYASFALFFPHLVAGPILRHEEFGPQIHGALPRIRFANFLIGSLWFLVGFIKKVYIADNAAVYANALFGDPNLAAHVTSLHAWLCTLAFTVQIYFDFSGYSDMAIGLAYIFGFVFPLNFDEPYRATTIAEFWSRWHMTLSRFLRDYVYIPLGGNRKGPARQTLNLMATMLISGLWHGAGWTFLLWGFLHGLLLTATHQVQHLLKKFGIIRIHVLLRWSAAGFTLLFVVLTWVYFRAGTLDRAHAVLGSMLGFHSFTLPASFAGGYAQLMSLLHIEARATPLMDFSIFDLAAITILMALAVWLPATQRFAPLTAPGQNAKTFSRLQLGIAGVASGIMLFFAIKSFYSARPSEFIYFRF